ncbi:MAG: flagellar biosynthesis protein FlhB [Bdellovibrionaceae bacterium]|nr:flagellar biosynthesis protein FlhB [Pseudobdellovibrionaceae bacterium]MBX3034374.1 flagellar biosynthesis protein FlhB [Pseudobdellovibrionaceae bacterium]
MAEDQGEKTEQATDARREEFRRQGQVAHTRELSGALLFFAAAGVIWALGRFFYTNLNELFIRTMGPEMVTSLRGGIQNFEMLQFAAGKSVLLILPVMAAAAVIGAGSSLMQIGFLQVEDALSPKLERINPLSGFKRIFSLRGAVEGLKSLLKMLAVAIVLYFLLRSEAAKLPFLVTFSPQEIIFYISSVAVRLLFGVGMVMLILAGADYFYQRWDLERRMMMSKQEIKEEIKQREGDPQIKARIRRIQREMANRRMMDAIPKADVVITNPTHIAIVLKYSSDLPAPQLVAKGADLVAEKIKEIARQNNIPIVENKPLARTIFKTLKIGQVIPRELFVAVAEVLSYVFRLKRKKVRS